MGTPSTVLHNDNIRLETRVYVRSPGLADALWDIMVSHKYNQHGNDNSPSSSSGVSSESDSTQARFLGRLVLEGRPRFLKLDPRQTTSSSLSSLSGLEVAEDAGLLADSNGLEDTIEDARLVRLDEGVGAEG